MKYDIKALGKHIILGAGVAIGTPINWWSFIWN